MEINLKCCFLILVILGPYTSTVEGQETRTEAPPTYIGGKNNNIRGNIEQVIRVLLQDNMETKLEAITNLEYDINKDIQETADQIIIQLKFATKQIADKIKSAQREKAVIELIETINKRLAALEDTTKLKEHNIENLLNITEKIEASVLNSSYELALVNHASKFENDGNVITTLCDLEVKKSLETKYGTWKDNQPPLKDDLDTFVSTKTGCSFLALEYNVFFDLPHKTYDGSLLEWRVAARTREFIDIGITFGSEGVSFFIGEKDNSQTKIRLWSTQQDWTRTTPSILSIDRYVPFYLKLYNGTLSIGKECVGEPFFTREFTIVKGQDIAVFIKAWSPYGAKILYNCPVTIAGLSRR